MESASPKEDKDCMVPFTRSTYKGHIRRDRNGSCPRLRGKENGELLFNGSGGQFGMMKKVLEMTMVMVTLPCECT